MFDFEMLLRFMYFSCWDCKIYYSPLDIEGLGNARLLGLTIWCWENDAWYE